MLDGDRKVDGTQCPEDQRGRGRELPGGFAVRANHRDSPEVSFGHVPLERLLNLGGQFLREGAEFYLPGQPDEKLGHGPVIDEKILGRP